MAFFERTEEEIINNSLQTLSTQTNITQMAPASKTRFLLSTFAKEQGSQHQIFDENLMQIFIKYADSRFLGFLGDMLNLPRREASHAYATDDNFMWYVNSGTFGDINNGNDFTILAGEVVSTTPFEEAVVTPGLETQPVIEYVTTEDAICAADQSFVYCSVKASVEGQNSDLPRSVLNKHEVTNYLLSTNNLLQCTNRYAISTGDNRESDDSYRYRLANIFRARNLAIKAAIRLAAFSVAGVADIKEVACEQGCGSYSIYVKSLTPTTSPALLAEVSTVVSAVSSFGIRPFILAPEPIGLEFVAATSWSPRATAAQKTLGYAKIRDSLENYLNNLDIGEQLTLSDIIDELLFAETLVQNIGANKINNFEEVYVYRSDPASEGTIRSLTTGTNIVPLYNERIILETSGRHRGIQFLTR